MPAFDASNGIQNGPMKTWQKCKLFIRAGSAEFSGSWINRLSCGEYATELSATHPLHLYILPRILSRTGICMYFECGLCLRGNQQTDSCTFIFTSVMSSWFGQIFACNTWKCWIEMCCIIVLWISTSWQALNCVLSVSSDSVNISLRIAFDINYIPTSDWTHFREFRSQQYHSLCLPVNREE